MENDGAKEYFFNICWENINRSSLVIGKLAKIDKSYYLKMLEKDRLEEDKVPDEDDKKESFSTIKKDYSKGTFGILGFKEGTVYKSNELFDFFKFRINRYAQEPCEELAKTNGRIYTDSYFVKQIPEEQIEKLRNELIEQYELQQAKLNEQNKNLIHSL